MSEDGWIDWRGKGRRPADAYTYVECRCRDGSIVSGRVAGFSWRWDKQPPGLDIIAYRVLSQGDTSNG